ncbi:MAG: methyltransferase [Micrococcus sp.]|nr:methyltransferase [Micrococcus sp.]
MERESALRTPDLVLGSLPETYTAGVDASRLQRWPLPASRERVAHTAADTLVLDTLAGWEEMGRASGALTVLNDQHGAVALPVLAARGAGGADGDMSTGSYTVRVGVDEASAARSIRANAERLGLAEPDVMGVTAEALAGARTVLLSLPRSLAALDFYAGLIATHADPDVLVLAAGRDKHMTPSMNEVLSRWFGEVLAGRGRSKSRVLTAVRPRRGRAVPGQTQRSHRLEGIGDLVLSAGPLTFGGPGIDPGTRRLVGALAQRRPDLPAVGERAVTTASGLRVTVPTPAPELTADVLDLGCGNGLLTLAAARLWPQARILASDHSADAVASTRATAELNGVGDRVHVQHDDAAASVPEHSVRVVLLNPPFHDGTAVDASVGQRLIREAGRVLVPGGSLWCVVNAHLNPRPLVESAVGPTRQVLRDRSFVVLHATAR